MDKKIQAFSINLKQLKKYTYFYSLALTLLAVLMVAANLYIQNSLSEQLTDSEVVNLSARQRALNQTILKDILLVRYDHDRSIKNTVGIRNNFKEWVKNDSLLRIDDEFAFTTDQKYRYNKNLYFELEKSYTELRKYYYDFLQDIENDRHNEPEIYPEWDKRINSLLVIEDRYDRIVDEITYRYATEAKQKVAGLKSISGNLLNIMLIILLIEAFLIFKPIISQFWYTIEQFNEKSIKLFKANEDNTKIFKVIAHDLKNHIAASISSNDMIIEYYDKLPPEKLFSLVSRLRGSLTNLNDILNNLLAWALSQNMELKPRYDNFNIRILADEILSQVTEHALSKQVNLIKKVPETIITADRNMISVIIRNLLLNAIKYCKINNTVELVFEDHGTYYNLMVYDNGIGMTQDKLTRLFMTNAESTKGTKNEKGTGLGLKICKEFAELHKGSIVAESTPGVGTKITVKLPKYRKIQVPVE
ncbi:MAG: sensor histidine kinase [Candidatus Kapabacteria bacterium]|nr:sensor histidine kinase [Ignavibacteriota bacterium]MCW5885211.1 sensor histidine kinase [Candidatus Kapabacteria bacterium]